MKVVILAGGLGTRLAEETAVVPKPMVEVGGRPILWHIMKIYGSQGFDQFVVALGYKGDVIKRFFYEFQLLGGNITIDFASARVLPRSAPPEPWTLDLIETGAETMTGGRLKRLAPLLRDGPFMLTYGDGVADVDLPRLLAYHKSHGRLATITAVRPPSRFGGLTFDGNGLVTQFSEKPQIGEGWINGGFMVLDPAVLDRIAGDESSLESDVLEELAKEGQLAAYQHGAFWQCMDTLRDKRQLEQIWESGRAAWKLWS